MRHTILVPVVLLVQLLCTKLPTLGSRVCFRSSRTRSQHRMAYWLCRIYGRLDFIDRDEKLLCMPWRVLSNRGHGSIHQVCNCLQSFRWTLSHRFAHKCGWRLCGFKKVSQLHASSGTAACARVVVATKCRERHRNVHGYYQSLASQQQASCTVWPTRESPNQMIIHLTTCSITFDLHHVIAEQPRPLQTTLAAANSSSLAHWTTRIRSLFAIFVIFVQQIIMLTIDFITHIRTRINY